jgi:hypothetical protein
MWEHCRVLWLESNNRVVVRRYEPTEKKHELRGEIAHRESVVGFDQVLAQLKGAGWKELSPASGVWPEAEPEPGTRVAWLIREVGT